MYIPIHLSALLLTISPFLCPPWTRSQRSPALCSQFCCCTASWTVWRTPCFQADTTIAEQAEDTQHFISGVTSRFKLNTEILRFALNKTKGRHQFPSLPNCIRLQLQQKDKADNCREED